MHPCVNHMSILVQSHAVVVVVVAVHNWTVVVMWAGYQDHPLAVGGLSAVGG